MRLNTCLLTAACAVGFLGTAAAAPRFQMTPAAQDAGPTASSTLITTSIYLNVTDLQGLQRFVADTTTPGSPDYRHFLSVSQFRDRFAPSNSAVSDFVQYLESFGITVGKVYADNLDITATGTADEFNAAFSTQLRDYTRDGQRLHRSAWHFALPSEFASLVLAAPGLNSAPTAFRPHIARVGQGAYAGETPAAVTWPKSGTASGTPQQYTVGDVANFYDVNPLYRQGINGSGQTIGIMTLANFNESDAYAYWNTIGLKVLPNRITKVMVDGGITVQPGVGDDETSLDVEQSGGLAPEAKIRVYIAPNPPNSNSPFIDLFYTAASENMADTVSISWGQPEEFYFADLNGGVDFTSQMRAIDQALLEGAAQGQSFFAASGDSGAYDVNRSAPVLPPKGKRYPYFSKQLSVDSPANDPYITAAGGTTVPATILSSHPECQAHPITIPQEQVWGWEYIYDAWKVCRKYAKNQQFATGGGGGVSSFWPIPDYQQYVDGMQKTRPGQTLTEYTSTGPVRLIKLPAGYPGRNMPDISLNADPETGYMVLDCTDFQTSPGASCSEGGWGGTSFVAPQLNGMTALIDQAAGGRVGLLNPVIYPLQQVTADWWSRKPFNDITAGDNWFYHGVQGYDDGAGIGTVNLANLASLYMMFSEGGDHGDSGNRGDSGDNGGGGQ
ncbi:MAG: S53 family peptidase [Sciscionella sp.]